MSRLLWDRIPPRAASNFPAARGLIHPSNLLTYIEKSEKKYPASGTSHCRLLSQQSAARGLRSFQRWKSSTRPARLQELMTILTIPREDHG